MNLISLTITILSNLIVYSIFEKSSFKGGLIFRFCATSLILFINGTFSMYHYEIINQNSLSPIIIPSIILIAYCIITNAIQFLIYIKTRSFFSYLIVSEIIAVLLYFGFNYLLPMIFLI